VPRWTTRRRANTPVLVGCLLTIGACAAMPDGGKKPPAAPAPAAAPGVAAAVAVADRTFTNPILPGMYPDPSICRVGADFYLVNSSFEYFPGVPIFHSRDLVTWTQIGRVLTRDSQLDLTGVYSSGGIYAPTLRHHAGRFYMITTLVGSPKRGGNFFVTAEDPRGPWSDPIWVDRGEHGGFDPSLLFAGGDVYYLRDGKGADKDHPRVYQARIDPTTGALREPMQPIWNGTGGIWPEGAHVYQMKGRYYLFAAEGGTEYGHSEVVGRSASPAGPFEAFPGNPILTHRDRADHPIQATGHADIVELDDGTTWAVFLGVRQQKAFVNEKRPAERFQHLGRETFLSPVRWSADGWPMIGDAGRVELSMPAPRLPPQPAASVPARDDFERPALGLEWTFVRNPVAGDVSLTARPGFLRVVGSGVTLNDVGSPAMIVRRQQHFRVRCRATLEFVPRVANEEAGLTVRASERFHYDLAVRLGDFGREVVLTYWTAGKSTVMGATKIPDGPVTLEILADELAYGFSVDGGTPLPRLPTRTLSAEVIHELDRNHFTGTVIGLYATGNGKRSTVPADFDWFEYQPVDN
jgi:xylan 1,4-beta-xylosidase